MPDRPTSVKVGFKRIPIYWSRGRWDYISWKHARSKKLDWRVDPETDGFFDYPEEPAIYVRPGLNAGRQRTVVWHEIKHAVSFAMGLKERGSEEYYVTEQAPLELMVMRNNKEVMSWLLRDSATARQWGKVGASGN